MIIYISKLITKTLYMYSVNVKILPSKVGEIRESELNLKSFPFLFQYIISAVNLLKNRTSGQCTTCTTTTRCVYLRIRKGVNSDEIILEL